MQLIPTPETTAADSVPHSVSHSAGNTPRRPPANLRLALAAATGSLLAAACAPALAQQTPPATPAPAGTEPAGSGFLASTRATLSGWQADTAVLYYAESAGRVKAIEPIVQLTKRDGDDRVTSLRLTLDSLTGASPTGAVPSPTTQTVTSASGQHSTVIPAGTVPKDSGFKDFRTALNVSHERPWGENRRIALGLNTSLEQDFASLGANLALMQDFNGKNTTLSLGLAGEFDRIKPKTAGGEDDDDHETPPPAVDAWRLPPASGTRRVVDLLLGVTQVMNRRWLMQFNVGPGRSSGSHEDPYKVLSVVDGATGIEVGDAKVSETRPRLRKRLSVYWQNKVHVDTGVLDLAVRRYRDDWGVRSTTLEASYRHKLPQGWYVEPGWRGYRQTAADFYRPYLVEGTDYQSASHQAVPANASADPRLAAFRATSLSLKVGLDLGRGRELGVRVMSYSQKMDPISGAPGYLNTVRLTEDLKATSVMVGYTHLF